MTARSNVLRPLVFALAAALMAAPLHAQEASLVPTSAPAVQPAAAGPASDVASAGPRVESASVAVRRTASEAPAPMPAGQHVDSGMRLMVVGGAAILTGIVIGGDAGHAISIGGAVVGLIGLYQYLQ